MKIALGTQSANKIAYLKNVLGFFKCKNYELSTYNVASGISEQPLSKLETIAGAKNRAFNAFKKDKDANMYIGMEGGLEFIENDCYYVCVSVVYNRTKYYTGISSMLKVPSQIADKIKNYNADLSDELNNYNAKTLNQEILKNMILSREEMFFEALRNVMFEVLE